MRDLNKNNNMKDSEINKSNSTECPPLVEDTECPTMKSIAHSISLTVRNTTGEYEIEISPKSVKVTDSKGAYKILSLTD